MGSLPRLLALITILALVQAPGLAQDRPRGRTVVEKIPLKYIHPALILQAFQGRVPSGITEMRSRRLENALTLRGVPSAIAVVKSASQVVDVPVAKGHGLEVSLERANPEAVRTEALALPNAGAAQIQGRTLRFEGDPTWLQAVQEILFRAELKSAGAMPAEAAPSRAGEKREASSPRSAELVVPAGVNLRFSADSLEVDAGTAEMRMIGNVLLHLGNGVELRAERASLWSSGANGERRIRIELLLGSVGR
jgi:hypothetical protein